MRLKSRLEAKLDVALVRVAKRILMRRLTSKATLVRGNDKEALFEMSWQLERIAACVESTYHAKQARRPHLVVR